ncbi:MAG: M20/M25/M40 family metallo-hydrolase [Pseudolabrys sp.]|nr:M20/M25/M40 family metallo-hydrolase [Pseudolabrys sp.]
MRVTPIPAAALLALCTVMPAAPAAQFDSQNILQRSQQLVEPFLDLDRRLVTVDSPSHYGPGIAQVGTIVEQAMRDLGGEVEVVKARVGPGNNLVGRWQGRGHRKILLLGHMDTVFKQDTTKTTPFRIDDKRAYGPGVLDDKGGIALALMSIRLLQELKFDDYGSVTLLATTDEEMRSLGSRDLILELGKAHDYAFVLEFGTPDDKVTTWRKGVGYLMVEVTGKAAHAGADSAQGCNAAIELAHQMLELSTLSDKEKETSVNFTIVQAGERGNIIPEKARAQADVRVLYPDEFDRLDRDVSRIASKSFLPCSRVEARVERGRPPFPSNRDTNALISKAQSIYREIGLDLGAEGSGGGTDGNYTASVGTATLDALGPVGGGAHTLNEYIELERIAPRIYLLARLMMEVSSDGH